MRSKLNSSNNINYHSETEVLDKDESIELDEEEKLMMEDKESQEIGFKRLCVGLSKLSNLEILYLDLKYFIFQLLKVKITYNQVVQIYYLKV